MKWHSLFLKSLMVYRLNDQILYVYQKMWRTFNSGFKVLYDPSVGAPYCDVQH